MGRKILASIQAGQKPFLVLARDCQHQINLILFYPAKHDCCDSNKLLTFLTDRVGRDIVADLQELGGVRTLLDVVWDQTYMDILYDKMVLMI